MVIELGLEAVEVQTDVIGNLRRATRIQLEQYDAAVNVGQMSGSRARYRWFLEKMYGFYGPIEANLEVRLGPFEKAGFDFSTRRKSSALLLDLLAIGVTRPELDELCLCETSFEINSPAQALGVLFVLEELIVGGEFVRQLISQRMGVDPDKAARFLAGYGANTVLMSRELSRVLASNISKKEEEEAIEAAQSVFADLLKWLEIESSSIKKCG